MTEGFDPDAQARRGRRNPELAAAMLADDDPSADAGMPSDQAYIGLSAGDTVFGKVTFASRTDLGDSWYTYGSQSQVLAGETAETAYERISAVITDGVMALAADFESNLNDALAQARDEARHRRIPQR
jgi:hypothetical protein